MSLPRAYEDPQEPGALGGRPTFCQSASIENPASATDSPISVELYAPQTPTDTVSHHPHLGL